MTMRCVRVDAGLKPVELRIGRADARGQLRGLAVEGRGEGLDARLVFRESQVVARDKLVDALALNPELLLDLVRHEIEPCSHIRPRDLIFLQRLQRFADPDLKVSSGCLNHTFNCGFTVSRHGSGPLIDLRVA